ncbi:hypothetical protein LEP1GSC008_3091 [Leptospira kirschneri serovar Bulgarica str. Nikolaevo]|uniref:Uncharacterized protein n=1 Tax=Leptospira kirschneri serovar Bulgarica str. Nikolaevo TaxID=1240687 RepID=M6F9A2_9LEPT|nr:hypothetical protein LEP1GSC008_3091 [Leptospira kirschneri serovar Bulgarica str. Nikolaevo]
MPRGFRESKIRSGNSLIIEKFPFEKKKKMSDRDYESHSKLQSL